MKRLAWLANVLTGAGGHVTLHFAAAQDLAAQQH